MRLTDSTNADEAKADPERRRVQRHHHVDQRVAEPHEAEDDRGPRDHRIRGRGHARAREHM
jgi:hypothetical protein